MGKEWTLGENDKQGEWTLPDGWEIVPVRDVFEVHYGKGLVKSKRDESGKVPVYGSSGVVGYHIEALVDGPCIVVGRKGAVGQVYHSKVPCWPIDTTYYIQPPKGFSLEYVSYVLDFMKLGALDKSTAIPGLNRDDFYAQVLPIPPFSEQRRIVAEIETQFTRLDAAVVGLERAQANIRRYKAAVLQAACEGQLVPTEAELARAEDRDYEPADQLLARILAERRAKWEAEHPGKRYKEPAPPDVEGLPDLPAGWVWASLPQLGELNRGKSKHRPRNDERLFGGPYPFIQTGEIRQAKGTITTYSQTYSEFGLAQSRLWPKGTLCITIAANIAETAILGFAGCFPDSVVGFIPENGVDVRFAEYFIRTAKEELERYAPATAQKNINLQTLRGVAVPLPPSAEQHRIVAEVDRRLSVVAALEASVEAALVRAGRLRQAVLKQAFEGRLVLQDPDDEPASVLLERIRAEREGKRERKQARQMRLPGT